MKRHIFNILIAVLIAPILFTACKGGGSGTNEPTIEEQQLASMVGTWVPTSGDESVLLDNVNAPGDWSQFQITFNQEKTVTVSGDPQTDFDMFAVSTYQITGESLTNIPLQLGPDNVTLQIVNDTQSVLSFILEEDGVIGAKLESVNGNWTFDLTKQ